MGLRVLYCTLNFRFFFIIIYSIKLVFKVNNYGDFFL